MNLSTGMTWQIKLLYIYLPQTFMIASRRFNYVSDSLLNFSTSYYLKYFQC